VIALNLIEPAIVPSSNAVSSFSGDARLSTGSLATRTQVSAIFLSSYRHYGMLPRLGSDRWLQDHDTVMTRAKRRQSVCLLGFNRLPPNYKSEALRIRTFRSKETEGTPAFEFLDF